MLGDAVLPLRIIWGYEGYRSESGLRNAFTACLKKESDAPRLMLGIPNLTICEDLAIVKANGMPFVRAEKTTAIWDICYSQRKLALRSLLYLLWARLTKMYSHDLPSLADGRTYRDNLLLSISKSPSPGNKPQFEFWWTNSDSELNRSEEIHEAPTRVTIEEFVVLAVIAASPSKSGLDLDDPGDLEKLTDYYDEQKQTAALFVPPIVLPQWPSSSNELKAALKASKFLFLDGARVRLATSRCVAWMNQAGLFAGENRLGAAQ